MLGRVGKGFGRNEVRRYLDRLREPHVRRDVEVDRDRGTPRERPQSGPEAALGKDRGVNPTRELLQALDRFGQSGRDGRQLLLKSPPAGH